ncbi:MAG: hypothetical protein S4CHLAM81_03580 [Chlamydiales bacterium]|nr:hypothetical protein [Chlamydiales bacterium]MCH9635148.1 hypothetical protein [Chlamydiales bacterium]
MSLTPNFPALQILAESPITELLSISLTAMRRCCRIIAPSAQVVKLVDTPDLGSGAVRCVGSSPILGIPPTILPQSRIPEHSWGSTTSVTEAKFYPLLSEHFGDFDANCETSSADSMSEYSKQEISQVVPKSAKSHSACYLHTYT